jgi:hypothetical protein
MKFVAVLLATLSLASAFAPATKLVRPSTELNALFDAVRFDRLYDLHSSDVRCSPEKRFEIRSLSSPRMLLLNRVCCPPFAGYRFIFSARSIS